MTVTTVEIMGHMLQDVVLLGIVSTLLLVFLRTLEMGIASDVEAKWIGMFNRCENGSLRFTAR